MAKRQEAGFATPEGAPGGLARLLSGQPIPAAAARIGARLAQSRGRPWRVGTTVIAARHADVREMLERDLDFLIAPVNSGRIEEVNGPFVLGMDRSAILAAEREALYRALGSVDMPALLRTAEAEAEQLVRDGPAIDAVDGFARPVAAHTAQRLFGVKLDDDRQFMDMTRAVFAHTFLNLSGDEAVRQRALQAAQVMRRMIAEEIARRAGARPPGGPNDMMGGLLRDGMVDEDGVRRTIGGMLVGAVDTTASSVAKILVMLGRDKALMARASAEVGLPDRFRGWCWEALRRWPHNPILLRQAARDTELAGVEVRRGDRVVAWTQAAMQDPSVFPDPDEMVPDRPAGAYLHFGNLLHACAGRVVNGGQIPLLVATLLQRGIASVGKIGWAGSFPAHLQVRFQ